MKLNRLVSTSGMDHATWLEYRKKGIGGSDAGSICGLNPYATAISVYQDKTQEEVTEKADNESMRQGRDLEEYVARRFMEETGKKVRRANSIFYMEENPFMLANVDRLIVGENCELPEKRALEPFSNTLQIVDLVSVYFNNPFFSHFSKLIGKRTSVYSKIIS